MGTDRAGAWPRNNTSPGHRVDAPYSEAVDNSESLAKQADVSR
jgi:hypothetical protein